MFQPLKFYILILCLFYFQSTKKVIEIAQVIADIREQLRLTARKSDLEVKTLQNNLLQFCDNIRDQMLPPLGVRLEDRDNGIL